MPAIPASSITITSDACRSWARWSWKRGNVNASIPAPLQVKEGMERIRWMPATNGGPGTYIQFGPHDRKGYKGDFLTIRELRGGELRFDGYHRPEWPSNEQAP